MPVSRSGERNESGRDRDMCARLRLPPLPTKAGLEVTTIFLDWKTGIRDWHTRGYGRDQCMAPTDFAEEAQCCSFVRHDALLVILSTAASIPLFLAWSRAQSAATRVADPLHALESLPT